MKTEFIQPAELKSHHAAFTTTSWSMVLAVGQADSVIAAAALERLCQTYWDPLYNYLRRWGKSEPDAKDLIQGFFEVLLRRQSLQKMKRGAGNFRSYLLTALNRYVIDVHDRAHARKRGGGATILSLDTQGAEQLYMKESNDAETPKSLYERRWALTVIDQALNRLAKEYAGDGKEILFKHLRGFIVAGVEPRPYAELAGVLGISEEGVRKAVQRLRRRYRQAVREEIAQTVTTTAQIEEELRYLLSVLSS